MSLRSFSSLVLACLALVAGAAQGAGQQSIYKQGADKQGAEKTVADEEGHVRVGGDYQVEAIDKVGDNAFRMTFKSTQPSGKFDTLVLDSDHVHVAVKVGQTLRLSAEILAVKGATADVAQMVIFLPHPQGHVPVWLLSNKAPAGELRGSKYLEMHSPMNDYMIM